VHKIGFSRHSIDLCFAATVHKMQGKTLPKVCIVAEAGFTFEMLLVAMTRVRRANNLQIIWPKKAEERETMKKNYQKLAPNKSIAEWFAGSFDERGNRIYVPGEGKTTSKRSRGTPMDQSRD
jgi:hypothetical protein